MKIKKIGKWCKKASKKTGKAISEVSKKTWKGFKKARKKVKKAIKKIAKGTMKTIKYIAAEVIKGIKIVLNDSEIWKRLIERIKESIEVASKQGLLAGVMYFIRQVSKDIIEIIKEYYHDKEKDEWYEQTTEYEVSFDDVPEDIKKKAEGRYDQDIDFTDELRAELELCN